MHASLSFRVIAHQNSYRDIKFKNVTDSVLCKPYFIVIISKGQSRATIFKSADTVYLKLLRNLGDAIRCAASADLKMVLRNRPLMNSN